MAIATIDIYGRVINVEEQIEIEKKFKSIDKKEYKRRKERNEETK